MTSGDQALRDGLAAGAGDDPPPGDPCPDPGLLWDAARSQLPRDQLEPLLDHVAACGACVEAWQLARAVQAPAAAPSRLPARRSWIAGGAALLAAAAAVLLLIRRSSDTDRTPTYRGEPSPIRSLIDDGARLPRDRLVLSWAPAGPGARYQVWIYTEELDAIDGAAGLDDTSYRVAPDRLRDLPRGAALSWRVEATLGNGTVVRSHTFAVKLE